MNQGLYGFPETAPSAPSVLTLSGIGTDQVLQSSDAGSFIVVSSTRDINITLPAANALSKNRQFTIKNNNNVFVVSILAVTGERLVTIPPGNSVKISASDVASTRGQWVTEDVASDAISGNTQTGFDLLRSGSSLNLESEKVVVSIDATRSIRIFINTSNQLQAVVTENNSSNSSIFLGTPVTIAAANSVCNVVMMSPTLCAIVYPNGDSPAVSYYTVSGNTLTFFAGIGSLDFAPDLAGNYVTALGCCVLSSTTLLVTGWGSPNRRRGRVVTLSGTTVQLGVLNTDFYGANGSAGSITCGIAAFNSTTAIITEAITVSTVGSRAAVLSVSGTGTSATISVGSLFTVDSAQPTLHASTIALTDTTALVACISNVGTARVTYVSRSATTLSQISTATFTVSSPSGPISLAATSTTAAIFVFSENLSGRKISARTVTISGGVNTISGTSVILANMGNVSGDYTNVGATAMSGPVTVPPQTATTAVVAYGGAASGSSQAYTNHVVDVSGATVVPLYRRAVFSSHVRSASNSNTPSYTCAFSATRYLSLTFDTAEDGWGNGVRAYLHSQDGTVLSTISIGTATGLSRGASVAAFSSTLAVAAFTNADGQTALLAITLNANDTLSISASTTTNGNGEVGINAINSTTGLVAYNNSSNLVGSVFTISGGTFTVGSAIQIAAGASNTLPKITVVNNQIGATTATAIITYFNGSAVATVPVLISTTSRTLSVGAAGTNLTSAGRAGAIGKPIGNNRAIFVSLYAPSTSGVTRDIGVSVTILEATNIPAINFVSQYTITGFTTLSDNVSLVMFDSTRGALYAATGYGESLIPFTIVDGDRVDFLSALPIDSNIGEVVLQESRLPFELPGVTPVRSALVAMLRLFTTRAVLSFKQYFESRIGVN